MMYRLHKAICAPILLCLAVSLPVRAVDIPKPGNLDSRIRYTTYDEDNVVQIIAYIGHATTVYFGKDEEIVGEPIFGNPDAWFSKVTEDNALTFKPTVQKGESANTNLRVLTNHHTYMFSLTLGGNNGIAETSTTKDMMYEVRFRYNKETSPPAAAVQSQPRNINYSALGKRDDFPYEIWDDNTSTYVRFYQQQDNPSFFAVDNAGSESIINSHINPDGTIVLHGLWRQIRLRFSDKRVVCIFKDDPILMTPSSGERTLDLNLKLKRK